ncbi:hypothetical protein MKX03_000978, partial [Papaver bracteatum]
MSATYAENFDDAFSSIRDQSSDDENIDLSRFLHSVFLNRGVIRDQSSEGEEVEAAQENSHTLTGYLPSLCSDWAVKKMDAVPLILSRTK